MTESTENLANIRKTLYLSDKVISWLEDQSRKENRSMSNYVETYFQNVIEQTAK